MLPPIWVAACDSQRRRNAAVAEDRERALAGRLGIGAGRSRRVTRPGPAAGRDRGAHRRVAALDEAREPALERPALEQDVAAAAAAAQADVGAEAIDEPGVAAARVRPAEADDVAEVELEHLGSRHPAGQGIKAGGDRDRDEVPVGGRQLEPVHRA